MKIQHIILIIIGVLFTLMVASFLFGASIGVLSQEAMIKEVGRVYHHRFLAFFVSILLFYISYTVIRTVAKKSTREELFISENDFEKVSVSLVAVQDVVRKVLRKTDNIRKYKLDMYGQQKTLILKIQIKQWEGDDIAAVTRQMAEDLKAKLFKITGLEGNVEVHIKIHNIEDEVLLIDTVKNDSV